MGLWSIAVHSTDPYTHTNTLSFTPARPFSSSCILIHCVNVCSAVCLWMLYRWLQVIVRHRAFLPLQSLDWVHLGQAAGYSGMESVSVHNATSTQTLMRRFLITLLLKTQSHLCARYAHVTLKKQTCIKQPTKWKNLTSASSCLWQIHVIYTLYTSTKFTAMRNNLFHLLQKRMFRRSQRPTACICMACSQVSASIRRHTSTVCCARGPTLIFTLMSPSV